MSATLRIHRGYASPQRVVVLGGRKIGQLSEEIVEFPVEPGEHVLTVRLGYSEATTRFRAMPGDTVEVKVCVKPAAPEPHDGPVDLELVMHSPYKNAHEGALGRTD